MCVCMYHHWRMRSQLGGLSVPSHLLTCGILKLRLIQTDMEFLNDTPVLINVCLGLGLTIAGLVPLWIRFRKIY